MPNSHDQEWWSYTRSFCNQRVAEAGPQGFKALVAEGTLRASMYLSQKLAHNPVPDSTTLKTAHDHMFGEVFRTAGHTRGPTQEVPFAQELGVSPHAYIGRDLRRLEHEAANFLKTAASKSDFCRMIAGYQARLVQISPFSIGTERLALAVAVAQVPKLLQEHAKLELGFGHYLEGLQAAIRQGNLGPLSYALTSEPLVGRMARPPFTMGLTLHLNRDLER